MRSRVACATEQGLPHRSLCAFSLVLLASSASAFGFGDVELVQAEVGGQADPAEAAKEMADVGAGSLPSVDLMIVVPSHSVLDADRRQVIRETWAQYLNKTAVNCTPCASHEIKLLFVVGKGDEKAIAAEIKEHDDVGLLEDFAQPEHGGDSEMTQRTIRYAIEHFRFKLLLKVDTSAWVFMDRLVNFLDDQHLFEVNASVPGVYVGNFAGPQAPALRDDSSLDEVFFSLTGSSFYPMYAKGAGFLLSPDLCEFISGMGAASEDTSGAPTWGAEYGWAPVPRLASLPHDEVSVGFWLLPVNHTKVHMSVAVENEACQDGKAGPAELVLDHHILPSMMKERWRNLLDFGDVCGKQMTTPTPHLRKGKPGASSSSSVFTVLAGVNRHI